MPKLNKKTAKEVDQAEETGGFEPLPEGIYAARLMEVNVSDQPGPSGSHYWTWVYEIDDEDHPEYEGRRIWNTTSLSPKAMGMPGGLKSTFAAFGVSADTDTDDLCGEYVMLHLSQEVQQKGKNAGKMQNVVESIMSTDAEVDGDDEEELF